MTTFATVLLGSLFFACLGAAFMAGWDTAHQRLLRRSLDRKLRVEYNLLMMSEKDWREPWRGKY